MIDATGLELIAQRVRDRVDDDAVTGTLFFREQATLDVAPPAIHDVLGYLSEADDEPWPYLMSLHGCDYLPEEPRLGVHYQLLSMERSGAAQRADAGRASTSRTCAASPTSSPPPTSRSARSTTCSAWSSAATPTPAGS